MENLLIYTIIGFVLYLIFSKPKKAEWTDVRKGDEVVQRVANRFILVEK